jgi:arylsulfatase A-like enzyme
MKRALILVWCFFSLTQAAAVERPNILWITSEDNGPQLGCYGDKFARTPNLDGLAERGMIYLNAWSTAPVCAPARTAIIMGMYPTSTGGHAMRSHVNLPAGMRMYPQFLREAGYYCANNSKEDYNLEKPGEVWDESSPRAHWKNRKPGQPFFAIFNHTITHESQVRARPHKLVSDPAKVPIPAYHPDIPEARRDWAQYYDKMEEMDALAGKNLRELEDAGLAEDTIIFYYGDHGPGMPRSKRWLYNSGLHVPLIVYVPEKWRHLAPPDYQQGGTSGRLASFVDLAPTLLSIVGIEPPEYMQGHPFMGRFAAEGPEFLFGVRDRMDERVDMQRAVRDERYLYIRNYMPHRIYGQYLDYMFQTPTTRVWHDLHQEGKLSPPQTFFWERKPPEELYDLWNDPDEINNLMASPEGGKSADRFREALRRHVLASRDLGFLPEAEVHARSRGRTPYELGQDHNSYPLERILEVAEQASLAETEWLEQFQRAIQDEESAVRYWGATGILIRGEEAVKKTRKELRQALEDPSPSVRIVAAEALGKFGTAEDLDPALKVLLDLGNMNEHGLYTAIQALNSMDHLGSRAKPVLEKIAQLPMEPPMDTPRKLSQYVPRLIERILETGAR